MKFDQNIFVRTFHFSILQLAEISHSLFSNLSPNVARVASKHILMCPCYISSCQWSVPLLPKTWAPWSSSVLQASSPILGTPPFSRAEKISLAIVSHQIHAVRFPSFSFVNNYLQLFFKATIVREAEKSISTLSLSTKIYFYLLGMYILCLLIAEISKYLPDSITEAQCCVFLKQRSRLRTFAVYSFWTPAAQNFPQYFYMFYISAARREHEDIKKSKTLSRTRSYAFLDS